MQQKASNNVVTRAGEWSKLVEKRGQGSTGAPPAQASLGIVSSASFSSGASDSAAPGGLSA